MVKHARDYLPEEKEVLFQLRRNLRLLRINAGLGQREIAHILRISRSAYSYYETGATTPNPAALYRLSQFYGVSAEVFFTPNAVPDLRPNIQRVRHRLKNQDPTPSGSEAKDIT